MKAIQPCDVSRTMKKVTWAPKKSSQFGFQKKRSLLAKTTIFGKIDKAKMMLNHNLKMHKAITELIKQIEEHFPDMKGGRAKKQVTKSGCCTRHARANSVDVTAKR